MTNITVSNLVAKVIVVNKGVAGEGVPVGGSTNQILRKSSSSDYDTEWFTLPTSAGDMLSANNLSDVANVDQARSNIGAISKIESIINALIFG